MDLALGASLEASVRDVLMSEWDPIRLRDLPADIQAANRDEYDSYILPIIERARAHPDLAELTCAKLKAVKWA